MKNPSISIIIPSWNQGKFIERTLLSIFKQDYLGKVEVIISDGGSTDETVEILKKYDDKLIWWSAPDKGFVDAVMKGAAVATGDLIGIQSSDDFYLEDAFKKIVKGFQDNPEAGFISGWDIHIDLENNLLYTQKHTGKITPKTALEYFTPQHSTLVKRDLFEEVHGVRADVDMCADLDLWYRISHLAPGYYVEDYLSAYQIHPDQRTKVSTKWYESLVRMVESNEANPIYGSQFKLDDDDKKNLYTFWRIGWTAKYDEQKARGFADEVLPQLANFNERTQAMILGHATPQIDNRPLFSKITSSISDGSFSKKIFRKLGIENSQQKDDKEDLTALSDKILWWKDIS